MAYQVPCGLNRLPMSLYENVRAYKALDCTERFDPVFALLGLSYHFPQHVSPLTVHIDYHGPVMRLLLDIIRVSGPTQGVVGFGERVDCLADCLQLEDSDVRWLSTMMPLQDVKLLNERLEATRDPESYGIYPARKDFASETLPDLHSEFPEWIFERGDVKCIGLDLDESGRLVHQENGPHTNRYEQSYQSTRVSFHGAPNSEYLKAVWRDDEVIALAAGDIRPGDMIVPEIIGFGKHTIDEQYTCDSYLVIRRVDDHVHRIVGLSLCDMTFFNSFKQEYPAQADAVTLAVRMKEVCHWYAQYSCRKRRCGAVMEDDEERVDATCFGYFRSLDDYFGTRCVKDDLCSASLNTIAPASPESAFVFLHRRESRDVGITPAST